MKQLQNRTAILAASLALAMLATMPVQAAETRGAQAMARPTATGVIKNGRIVGGTDVVRGERSYQVRTYNTTSTSDLEGWCGGTIIADSWVLTAAHCGRIHRVRGGVYNLANASEGTFYNVVEYIQHPNYDSGTEKNDFALIRINGSFNSAWTRARLPDAAVMQAVGKAGDSVVVSGWGGTSEGDDYDAILKQVIVPIVSDTTCNASSAYNGQIDPVTMLCAGLLQGGKDSCQGDSGGPLVATHNGAIYNLGVVSWGDGCARPNKYGVYSETVAVVDWIRNRIGAVTPPAGQTYTNGTDVAIGDNTTVTSSIPVAGRTGNGSATTPVAVDIVHTYIGDLKVDLIAPDGSVYVLHSRSGGDTDNINKTFTVNLSGEALNGTWKLRVNDNANQDTGYINAWSITF